MENMDSTVITTSLPAIAADIGEPPLALKLALTPTSSASPSSYRSAAGWRTAWAPHRVRGGNRGVHGRLGAVRLRGLAAVLRGRALRAGHGRSDDGARRPPRDHARDPKHEYVAALNYLTIPALLGPVVGPALGGAITLYFDWRWIFIINVPISVLGVFLVLRHIPNFRESKVPPFDLRGFALSSVGLSVLMLGLSALGGHLMPLLATLACIVAGVVALSLYVRYALRAPHPVIDLRLFGRHTFRDGVLIGSLFRIGIQSTPFLLPLLFQVGFGLDPLSPAC
jgi:hypothetical protein